MADPRTEIAYRGGSDKGVLIQLTAMMYEVVGIASRSSAARAKPDLDNRHFALAVAVAAASSCFTHSAAKPLKARSVIFSI